MTVNWHHSMDKNSNKTKTPAITLSPLDITSATSTPTQITKFTFETLNPSKSTSKSPKLQINVTSSPTQTTVKSKSPTRKNPLRMNKSDASSCNRAFTESNPPVVVKRRVNKPGGLAARRRSANITMSMPPQLNLDDIKKEDPLKKNSPFTINGKPKYELGPAAEILPFLYLGSAAHAVDTEALKKLGVTAMINCQKQNIRDVDIDGFKVIQVPIDDNNSANIKQYFDKVIDFINEEKRLDGKILVHCKAGISRSATICIAYLINSHGYTFDGAYSFVKSCRNLIGPNLNFLGQLRDYEKTCKGKESEANTDSLGYCSINSDERDDQLKEKKFSITNPDKILFIQPMKKQNLRKSVSDPDRITESI